MSLRDELRRTLDERGVEWRKAPHYSSESKDDETIFSVDGFEWYVHDHGDGYFELRPLRFLVTLEQVIAATLGQEIDGNTSDGYHTFNELYHHRAVLFSVIVHDHPDMAWKSKRHHDDTMYDGMFIVGLDTPWGQATYHYDIDPYWDMFGCKELESAPEWDGHTPDDAIERIGKLATLPELRAQGGERVMDMSVSDTCYCYTGDGEPPDSIKFVSEFNPSVTYVPERTCKNVSEVYDEHGQARFVCSECKAWIDSRVLWNPQYPHGNSPWTMNCKLNFCPNCGARIEVSE